HEHGPFDSKHGFALALVQTGEERGHLGRIAQAGILADRRALSNLRPHFREIKFARRNDILSTVNFRISSIDHVQIAAPAGCEQIARDFYGSLLGMVEIAKPAV